MAEDLVGADLADAERDLVEGFAPSSYDSWTVLFDEYADLTTELLPHARALAADQRWVGFAQAALRAAAERGRQVREGSREYRPDRLFTQDESAVLKRALLTALAVDADWVGLGIDAMDLASVAPGAARPSPRRRPSTRSPARSWPSPPPRPSPEWSASGRGAATPRW